MPKAVKDKWRKKINLKRSIAITPVIIIAPGLPVERLDIGSYSFIRPLDYFRRGLM